MANMDDDATQAVSSSLLKGTFDVFDAMLSLSFSHAITEIERAEDSALQDYVSRHPAVMRCKVRAGGAMALLFTAADASRFASLVLGEAPVIKMALDANDLATLREIAEPCLGGGITNLMERLGRNIEQPEDIEVIEMAPDDAAGLRDFLGSPVTGAAFTFTAAPDFDSEGVLLFSETLARLLAAESQAGPGGAEAALASSAHLSDAEMSDILSGFGPAAEQATAPAPARPQRASEVPPNIDLVLDIRLVATARLGHIEMPIGEILALGPGSIIQVGHVVDEPIELLINDKLVARGDVVVVDEKFGLRITEIVSPQERIESMR
jgi:flagellar motor switch protein FliN/FliY